MTARRTNREPIDSPHVPRKADRNLAPGLHGEEPPSREADLAKDLAATRQRLRRQTVELVEQRQAAEASRQRYLDLFEFAPEPCVVTDEYGVLQEVNLAALELLGLERERLMSKPLVVYVSFEDRPAFRSMMAEALKTGKVGDRTFKLIPPDGEPRYILMAVAKIPGTQPEELRWVLTDVSGRVKEQENAERLASELDERVAERTAQLVQALNVKDEFLGMISHELKTPITTIAGNAEVLRRRGKGIEVEQYEAAIGDIEAEARRLQSLIDDLLVLARAEAGAKPDLEPLAPEHVAARVVESCRRMFHRDIPLEAEENLPAVAAEQTYVEQVLRNLIGNAVKYSPAYEMIDVSVQRHPRGVVFRVYDRGGGIPEHELDKIFEPFYRSREAARQAQGAGIGLAVCKRLIDAQNGTMWAAPREGGGTEFAFTLPAAEIA